MPQDRLSSSGHPRHAYLSSPSPFHGQAASTYDLTRAGKRFSPTIRKGLEEESSGSSTRGSSPCTDASVFSSYAESLQSSRATSLPPDELEQHGIGSVSECDSDCRSPQPADDSFSPDQDSREHRRDLSARPLPGSPDLHPDESMSEGCTSSESEPESDSEDDNDWSQDDGLESTVISAVGGNLALASYLIPIIHKSRNDEYAKMIHAWQDATQAQGYVKCSPGGHHHDSPNYTSSSPGESGSGQSGGGPFKKRKRSNSDDFDRKREREDEEDGSGGSGDAGSPTDSPSGLPLLACPFHKLDPDKYSAKGGNAGSKKRGSFRACAGPGWKTIQRLKEHLRRNHSPVQCSRCFMTFHESDRPTSMSKLEEHHRQQVQCQVGDPCLREGISDVQWAELDKKRARKQDGERLGKWFEIWDILFPESLRPETPFYEWASRPQSSQSASPGREQIKTNFSHILDHMFQCHNIDFGAPYDEIKRKLVNATGLAFDVYRSTSNGTSEDSSTNSLTKTNTGSKDTRETQETAATSITLPVAPVANPTQTHPSQQYHNPASIPRTMQGAPQYTVPMGRAPPTMMAQMPGQVPRSPPMAQINFTAAPYYTMPAMQPTGWPMPQAGFDGTTQFPNCPMDGSMPMYYPMQDEWNTGNP